MSNINYSSFRRPYNFLDRKVRDALPEHFTTDYPKFITFLEKYYLTNDERKKAKEFSDLLKK